MKNKIFLVVVLLLSIIAIVLSGYSINMQKSSNERIAILEQLVKIKQEEVKLKEEEQEKNEQKDDLIDNMKKVKVSFTEIQTERSGLWEFLSLVFKVDGNVYKLIDGAKIKFYTDTSCKEEIENPQFISTNCEFVDVKNARFKCLLMDDGNVCFTKDLSLLTVERVKNIEVKKDYQKLFEEEQLKPSVDEFLKLEFKIDENLYEVKEDSSIKFYTDTSFTKEIENPSFLSRYYILISKDNYYFYSLPLDNGQIVFTDSSPLLELRNK